MSRLLLVVVLVVGLLGSARAGTPGSACCVCECAGAASQCTDVGSTTACPAILSSCGAATNATCVAGVAAGLTCAALPQCASAATGAPALDVTGLAIAIIVLGALAGLRLRRRPAPQRR